MGKLSSLLLLLSLVTTNIYVESFTITASVLTQMGYNNQSTYVDIRTYNNHIDSIDSIDPNALNGYDKLIRLSIHSDQLTTIDIEIFKGAVNLEELFIVCRSLNKFTNSKNIKLPRVTTLYFQNNLTSFNKPMFSAFPALISFITSELGRGGTKTVDVHTFESLSNLISLNLGNNLLTGFEYLQIPKNLKALHLDSNYINYFALSRTMGVLDYLDISRNRFRPFKSMDFTFLANLTTLKLGHNPHAYPHEIPGHLKPLVKLSSIDIDNLNISSIDSNYFKYNTNLWSINLRYNNISSLDNRTFYGLNRLRGIDLAYNSLTKISSGTFINPYLSVYITDNLISEIEPASFRGNPEAIVNLNNNKLTKILPGTFYNMFVSLSLSNNQITEIENTTFEGVSSIRYLDLSGNKIEKIAPGSFNDIALNELDLSGNYLTEIKNTMLAGQNQLGKIKLTYNKLSTIESGAFANLPNLRFVFLDYNQLTQLDSSMFAGSNNLETIYVGGNQNLSTANLQSLCPSAATNCQVLY